jgi:hypothetical protein
MKSNLTRILGVAAVLLVAAALSVSAAPVPQGREVPLDQNIMQYFAKNGVDPSYLSTPIANVPADMQSKISAILATPDFMNLIWADLRADAAAFGNTLYLPIGNTTFEYSQMAGGAQQSFSEITSS